MHSPEGPSRDAHCTLLTASRQGTHTRFCSSRLGPRITKTNYTCEGYHIFSVTIFFKISLIWVSDCAGASNSVRAYVAKFTHAVTRKERTASYQAQRHRSGPEQEITPCLQEIRQHEKLTYISPIDKSGFVASGEDCLVDPQMDRSLAAVPTLPLDSQVFTASQLGLQCTVSHFEYSLVKHYVAKMIPADKYFTDSLSSSASWKVTILREWLPVALGNSSTQMGLFLCASQSLYTSTGSAQFSKRFVL
ncbi:hypothetical protein F5Y16DRAFT_392985 [Xylariaceae sp. FL0255]|nr:hypothetical protein F5Y16DRAFT_392985 [Xylariaceae sp. FL0255]